VLTPIIKSDDMFWIGYLCCDPKPDNGQPRTSRYDLYVDEVKQMKFEGVKVLFNHNKQREPLGEVKLTWHDHTIPNAPFAVGFLAVIDNPMIRDTPACVILMNDSFASLSTLESDRTSVVELSITYCGARDGCTGVIVSQNRVEDMVNKYGLPQSNYYKCDQKGEVQASYKSRTGMDGQKNNETPTPLTPEDILKILPKDQYDILKEYMTKDQETLQGLLNKCDQTEKRYTELYKLLGQYSDYLSSMIQTRLMLEKDSDSDLARKRREGFKHLEDQGVIDKDSSGLLASKRMIDYCRECFKDSPENAHLERFWSSFKDQFPDLHEKLPDDKSVVTVDAAFSLISQKMRDQDVKGIVRKGETLNKRALEVARQAYDSIEQHKSKNVTNDTNRTTSTNVQHIQNNISSKMSFMDFLKKIGVNEDSTSDTDTSPPPPKKARKSHIQYHDEEEMENNREFLKYATQREEELNKLEKRYKSYKSDFQKQKRKRMEKREQQMESFMNSIPTLTKFAEYLEGQMKNEMPKQETSEEGGVGRSEVTVDQQQNERRDPTVNVVERNIEASALLRRDNP